MNPYLGRMRAMFIFACFPVLGLLAQPLGAYSAWWPAILIGLLGAGHQAWSANLFSTVGDMFPKSTIGTLVGLGTAVGGIGSMAINMGSGYFFTWALEQGSAFQFFGFEGKPAAYMVVFCGCAVAYLIGWCIMKTLVPATALRYFAAQRLTSRHCWVVSLMEKSATINARNFYY